MATSTSTGHQIPLAFPLPPGYYYGPLEGPIESISGEHEVDSQIAKDGLGRWQEALGLPVTKKWNDGATPKAAGTMQKQKGWQPNPLFGYGGVYRGRVGRGHQGRLAAARGLEARGDPRARDAADQVGRLLASTSARMSTRRYPYQVISFRASVADEPLQ